MPKITDLRSFLIEWNNTFPLDREYRKKNGIAFNSEKHRSINQIDVFLEWQEAKLFEEHEISILEQAGKKIKYEKGEWISEKKIEDEELDEAFDKIAF